MAEAILADRLRARGIDAVLSSAGLVLAGRPATDHTLAVLSSRGLDHGMHRSRIIDTGILESADLILAMTREHLREAAVTAPATAGRIFTLKELVRRAEHVGPRSQSQDLDEWLLSLSRDRDFNELLGGSAEDDVADPYGMDRVDYERTCAEIEALVDRLVPMLWGTSQEADRS